MIHYSSTLHHPLPNHANEKKEINTNWKFVFKSCTWAWAYKYRLWTIIIIKESATWFELITQQEKKTTQEQTTANKTISIQSTWLTIGYGNLQHFILCFALSAPVVFFFLSFYYRQRFSPPLVFCSRKLRRQEFTMNIFID